MDVLGYIESGYVVLPDGAPFVNDFVAECEAFTADNSHLHDDQVDPMMDAITDMLAQGNAVRVWENAL
jgi:predicted phage terminase large subunit-like protein